MIESMSETDTADLAEGATEEAAATNGESGERPRRRRRRRRSSRAPEGVEPSDDQTALVFEFMSDVIVAMGIDCRVHLKPPQNEEDRDIRLELTGPDAARIIGKRGQTLGALQFLANRVLNRPGQERRYVTVDAEGYRSRRDDSLAAMAQRLGKQAVSDGKIITFEPMSPRDRRVVHLALAKFEGVITKSEGDGEDRRVQIIPVRRGASTTG